MAEIYRYPGNRYRDTHTSGGGCEKPIFAGGHIVGWTACFDEQNDCEDSDQQDIDNSFQEPIIMPWPEEPPYEPPYDPWREEWNEYWRGVNIERANNRRECAEGFVESALMFRAGEEVIMRAAPQSHSFVHRWGGRILVAKIFMTYGCFLTNLPIDH